MGLPMIERMQYFDQEISVLPWYNYIMVFGKVIFHPVATKYCYSLPRLSAV